MKKVQRASTAAGHLGGSSPLTIESIGSHNCGYTPRERTVQPHTPQLGFPKSPDTLADASPPIDIHEECSRTVCTPIITKMNDDATGCEPAKIAAVTTSPLDLSVKRKISDAETNDAPPDQPQEMCRGDCCASDDDDGKTATPLDLSRTMSFDACKRFKSEPVAQRPSVVVRSPLAAAAPAHASHHPAPVSPLVADHVPPLPAHYPSPDAAYQPHRYAAEYNSFLAAAVAAATAPPAPPLQQQTPLVVTPRPKRPSAQQLQQQQQQQQPPSQPQQSSLPPQTTTVQYQHHHHHLHHQPAAAFGPGVAADYDFNMMMPKMTSPVYVATSNSSLSSSSESNPFGGSGNPFDYLPYAFGYPFFGGMLGGGAFARYGQSARGLGGDGRRPERRPSPESTTVDHHHHHHHRDDVQRNRLQLLMNAYDNDDLPHDPVDPEEVAAIYKQSDFVSFRNRYLESLGPPKNFEKMRRSVPNKKPHQDGDVTYVMKRKKNNEAAKRSRDAKRQKYIENQISVMYLTKKVSEMKEIKRRLLMAM